MHKIQAVLQNVCIIGHMAIPFPEEFNSEAPVQSKDHGDDDENEYDCGSSNHHNDHCSFFVVHTGYCS